MTIVNYFIIGAIITIGLNVWSAITDLDGYREDIRGTEWWIGLGFVAMIWPWYVFTVVMAIVINMIVNSMDKGESA